MKILGKKNVEVWNHRETSNNNLLYSSMKEITEEKKSSRYL